MSRLRKNVTLSPKEYLHGEQYSEIKHEYEAGYAYAMAGASKSHNLITGNLYVALCQHLRNKSCQIFISDMKVRVQDRFYYPDVLVTCHLDEPHQYYVKYPLLIIEVSSPSTEAKDNLDKRIAYQSLESLKEYILVAQEKREVRIYRRSAEGWDLETYAEGDQVNLTSIALEIPIDAVYERV